MTENSTPIDDDDESIIDGVRYETWTDRRTGEIYVRADFSDQNAEFPTLTERPDTDSPEVADVADFESGTVFGSSGIEEITLSYPYYTSTETAAPYDDQFTPDWALDTLDRHGYPVNMDDPLCCTDGGDTDDDYQFKVSITVTATLPAIGEKTYTFSMKVSDESEIDDAEERAADLVPEDGEVDDIDTAVERL